MNIYVSKEIKEKWPGYTFIGKPFKLSDGKNYIRAHSKCFGKTHYYCYELDIFWHERPDFDVVSTGVNV